MKELLIYFWIFVLSSFLGFLVETIWCFIRYKKIESRKGLIYEPMIPIYGISGTLIVLLVRIFNLSKWYEIFGIGFVISTVVEYVSSFIQEKLFATKSWDYSNFPFNLRGRVNLLYSILFGIVALAFYKLILYPFMELFMNCNINLSLLMTSVIMFCFMIYDFIISLIAVYRMKERKRKIQRKSKFWNYIDKKYNDKFLKKIYANMVDV